MARRYRQVDTRIWNDECFDELSVEEALVALWCLTSDSVNRCGIVVCSLGELVGKCRLTAPKLPCDDTGVPYRIPYTQQYMERCRVPMLYAFDTLSIVCDKLGWGCCKVSRTTAVVILSKWFFYNPPANQKHFIGMLSDLHNVPCFEGLLPQFYNGKQYLDIKFHAKFDAAFGEMLNRWGIPYEIPYPIQYGISGTGTGTGTGTVFSLASEEKNGDAKESQNSQRSENPPNSKATESDKATPKTPDPSKSSDSASDPKNPSPPRSKAGDNTTWPSDRVRLAWNRWRQAIMDEGRHINETSLETALYKLLGYGERKAFAYLCYWTEQRRYTPRWDNGFENYLPPEIQTGPLRSETKYAPNPRTGLKKTRKAV